jgi:hypothetical protein
MTLKIGRFVLEVTLHSFYARLPHVGECFFGRGDAVLEPWSAIKDTRM